MQTIYKNRARRSKPKRERKRKRENYSVFLLSSVCLSVWIKMAEELDLELGLSMGGSFRKSPDKSISSSKDDCTERSHSRVLSLSSSDGDTESVMMDSKQKKRVIRNFDSQIQERPLKKEKQEDLGSQYNVMKLTDFPEKTASFQFVPLVNSYGFPWAITYRSFVPFPIPMNQNLVTDFGWLNGGKLEENGSERGGNWKIRACDCESTVCSSSVVSDNYQSCSSHEGGSSSSNTNAKSNLTNSSLDQHQMTGRNANDDMNNCSSLHHVEPKPYSDNKRHSSENFVQSHVSITSSTINSGIEEELAISSKHEVPSSKSIYNTVKSNPMTPKNIKIENGKPPKPKIKGSRISKLQQMPHVSTTGRNGETTVGILCSYSKEIKILCVCHGESFSPAEFVKHAGGAEVSHPLRHITVLPTDGGILPALR